MERALWVPENLMTQESESEMYVASREERQGRPEVYLAGKMSAEETFTRAQMPKRGR